MPTFTNHLQFIALPRSGHHAVMDWVEHQLNNFEHQGPLWDKGCTPKLAHLAPDALLITPPPDKNVDWYIWTCECSAVGYMLNYLSPMEVPKRKLCLLVVRSLKNWLASYTQWYVDTFDDIPTEEHVHQMLCIWQDHAIWALHGDDRVKVIMYDKWFASAEYRLAKSKELAIYTKKGFHAAEILRNRMSAAGGGSSFDGMSYDGEATEMNVLNRWDELDDTTTLDAVIVRRPDVVLLDTALSKL